MLNLNRRLGGGIYRLGVFICKLPSVCVFFPKGWELKLRFVKLLFCQASYFGMIGGKRLSKWSAYNFEMPMRWWKRLEKSSKGLTWSCRRTRAMSLPVFKTSQISVRRLVVLFFLLTLLVVSLWIFFVASCMPRSSQRDRRSHSTRSLLSMDLLRSFACCKLSHDWQQRRNACGSLH